MEEFKSTKKQQAARDLLLKMEQEFETLKVERRKWAEEGKVNKSAVVRSRKALMNIKNLVTPLRQALQEVKEEAKAQ